MTKTKPVVNQMSMPFLMLIKHILSIYDFNQFNINIFFIYF